MNNSSACSPQVLSAILLEPIFYYKTYNNELVKIEKGTVIRVDYNNSIALIDNDHVHIDTHEYKLFC